MFYGFWYVEVLGWFGDFDVDVVVGVFIVWVFYIDFEWIGWFVCFDLLVEQLYCNVVWGMWGNFVDILIDCLQWDECVGWIGDIQVFGLMVVMLFDVVGMLMGWLWDVEVEQLFDGMVLWFVLVIFMYKVWLLIWLGVVWGDVVMLLFWILYWWFGDVGVFDVQFDSVRCWVDKVELVVGVDCVWDEGFQFGDWFDFVVFLQDLVVGWIDCYFVVMVYFVWLV